MKLAVYGLILVIVAAAVVGIIGMGVGLIDRHPSGVAGWQGERREVYVDLEKVVVLHPGWAAVQTMKSTSADIAASRLVGSGERTADVSWLQLPDVKARSAASRWKLEDSAARRADDGLMALRAEQLAALQARLDATRKTMTDSAEADVRQRAYEIDQDAASKISAISQAHSHSQINLRVKAGALRSMLGQPGVDEADIKKKLAAVESDLSVIERDVKAQVTQVTENAQKAIRELRASSDAKIASALKAYGNRETRSIEDRISAARNQVMSDICSLSDISDPTVHEARGSDDSLSADRPVLKGKPAQSAAGEVRQLNGEASRLDSRIRKDVVGIVQRIADEQHLKVVFTRKGTSVPDETAKFVGLIKDRGWRLGAPVVQSASGI